MTIVSDTNILGSIAAAHAFRLLTQLFARSTLSIPPAVRDELLVAVERGISYLEGVTRAITAGEIAVLELTAAEHALATTLPRKLNAGEREAIALCQQRHLPLLCNDRRAIRYCQANRVETVDLPTLLRLFWTRQVTTRAAVEQMIGRMEQIERLTLSDEQRAAIFASQRRRG